VRTTPYTQSLDLEQGGEFNAENIEDAIDKNTKLILQNKDRIDRLLRFPTTDPSASVVEMPSSIDRAGKFLYFGATNGEPTTADATVATDTTVSDFMVTVLDDADADAARNTLGGTAQFEADFYADFSTAISTIGATEGELHIRSAQAITTTETVPATLALIFHKGGSLSISGTKTVTINGPIRAGPFKIFTLAVAGSDLIAFGEGYLEYVLPQWFGAVGDGTTDDTAEFDAADTSIGAGGGMMYIPKGDYVINDWMPRSSVVYRGAGISASRIIGTTSNAITLTGTLSRATFEHLGFTTTSSYACIDTDANAFSQCTIRNCNFEDPAKYGLQGYYISCLIDHCLFGISPATGKMTSSVYLTGTSNYNTFSNCLFEKCTGPSISIGVAGQGYHNVFHKCLWDNLDDKVMYIKAGASVKFLDCWAETINIVTNTERCVIEFDTGNTEVSLIRGFRLAGSQGFTNKFLLFTGNPRVRFIGNSVTTDYTDLTIVTLKAHDRFWHYGNAYVQESVGVADAGYRYYRDASDTEPVFYENALVSYGNETIYHYNNNHFGA
jgi:hypothetical protein